MGIQQKLKAPTAYQGGKSRLAERIVQIIYDPNKDHYYDLCCGSGAVSLELVKKGVKPKQIYMADQGPWGLFWSTIGNGSFDLQTFEDLIRSIPKSPELIQNFVKLLSKEAVDQKAVYKFLVLQAASFGSKPIWIKDGKWQNCSFRNYWKPTATSKRRFPVNPMMPMPETLYKRVDALVSTLKGINGFQGDIHSLNIKPNSVIYIDPPYQQRTAYGYQCDAVSFAKSCKEICFISEGFKLSQNALLLDAGRTKGGVSGARRIIPNQEWLNIFN